ncbi:MAG: hypothetical protein Q8O35_07055 [Humidesulfovibrio sp.]|uniref:hypothetical protein n=1 Tax=Humidesulfovibrio sp. TaxID=2910988 RepID=UPI002732E72D|nr:hypothetical protein [Humidesulfovibrio sp.]MDP2847934.1 hypothetical protein [Humidesulfovibrio sp.]
MAEDFRKLLKDDMRNDETGERWFQDLEIGDIFFFSIQASSLHGSAPAALLDDVMGYEGFQVTVQSKHGVFAHGKRGAWQHLENKPWWPLFEADSPIVFVAESVPVATVQQIYEDLLACVEAHPEMISKKCLKSLATC